jgi:OOP family OmpA-OmpF porin
MARKSLLVFFTPISLAAIVAGCAASRPPSLDRAQASLSQAKQNPLVIQSAPASLTEAQATMVKAEQAWHEDRDVDEANHLSYIVEQKANIALAAAQQKAAEKEAQQLLSKRDEIRLKAREHEVARVRERAQSLENEVTQAREQNQSLEQELAALKAKETERGLVMTLQNDILFELNKAELKPGAMRNLYPLITFLKDHPQRNLLIEGYTDSTGSDSYNLNLSQRRAAAVRDFLSMNGISPDRIKAQGYGEEYPVATNSNEAGRAQNRRVELIISEEGKTVVGR